ncbi:trypsin-like peptidase domain-containing protein [Saccharothrix sp.]|uniref:nSTAND1 domain-containing NTPase n=1 Tax=Saccharothrix sp. TaxID=1873460 RepID=UPI002812841D|nr:trypsin-like peptidase domain-containing protein [Saccharothrix sp.]
MEPAERAVVRVFRDGGAVGMGFPVGEDLVLTCAHVVGDEVDFPFLGAGSAVSEVFRSDLADVAVLRVADVPAGPRALRVVAHEGLRDHRVRAFGVTAHRPDGVWSHGVVRGPIAGGRIHVEDDRSYGVPLSRGFSGGPLLDDELGAVVGMVVEVEERADRRIGYALSGTALHETWPDLAASAASGSPFRGLEPFGPEDAEHFFGRAARARELRDLLDGTGVLVVAGASGSGKSSLVMAGLLPLLDGDSIIVRPAMTSTPRAALSAVLDVEVTPERVEDAVNRVLVHRDLRRLTIAVDQFDEAVARHPDAPDFLHALLSLVRHRAPRVDVVVTTTTEPLLRVATDPRFSTLPDRTTTVGTPDLRKVIEGPLRPVGMPVLQEGLAGAVSTYAEQVWQRFDPTEIRHALTQLVSPLPGGGHVRRAVPIEDLGEIAGPLARTRLVTAGPSTVELAHHALVDHWQRLHDRVEESRDFRTGQDTLDRTAHHWASTRDRALLPRGKPLRKARTIARTHPLTPTQRHFLTAATKARTRRTTVRTLAAAVVALLVLSLVAAIRIADDEQTRSTTLNDDFADTAVSDGSGRWIAYARGEASEVRVRAPDGRTTAVPLPGRLKGTGFSPGGLSLVGVLPTGEAVVESGTGLLAVSEFGTRELGPGKLADRPGQAEPTVTRCDGTRVVAVGAVSGATVAEDWGVTCASAMFSADGRAVAARRRPFPRRPRSGGTGPPGDGAPGGVVRPDRGALVGARCDLGTARPPRRGHRAAERAARSGAGRVRRPDRCALGVG